MSRAFLNEDKFEQAGDELIERPISPHPNYVTPTGAQELQSACETLYQEKSQLKASKDEDAFSKQRLTEIDRDLRYFSARLESAIIINPKHQPQDTVLFGATVEVEDENGIQHTFSIVGEDEANIAQHKVSYVSPLAKALIGHRIGETVIWLRPAGSTSLDIINIHY